MDVFKLKASWWLHLLLQRHGEESVCTLWLRRNGAGTSSSLLSSIQLLRLKKGFWYQAGVKMMWIILWRSISALCAMCTSTLWNTRALPFHLLAVITAIRQYRKLFEVNSKSHVNVKLLAKMHSKLNTYWVIFLHCSYYRLLQIHVTSLMVILIF